MFQSLSWAVSKGNLSAVRALLKAGADPKKKHCDGQTAIDIAMSDEVRECCHFIQRYFLAIPFRDVFSMPIFMTIYFCNHMPDDP